MEIIIDRGRFLDRYLIEGDVGEYQVSIAGRAPVLVQFWIVGGNGDGLEGDRIVRVDNGSIRGRLKLLAIVRVCIRFHVRVANWAEQHAPECHVDEARHRHEKAEERWEEVLEGENDVSRR